MEWYHWPSIPSGMTPGAYVTGCGPSASAHALWDSGELHSSNERDSFFPCSTPGEAPPIQELISLSQPEYGQVGDYE